MVFHPKYFGSSHCHNKYMNILSNNTVWWPCLLGVKGSVSDAAREGRAQALIDIVNTGNRISDRKKLETTEKLDEKVFSPGTSKFN